MKAVRVILSIAVLVNLSLLVIYQHARRMHLRYESARIHSEIARKRLENRVLLLRLAEARRPESVVRRAGELGIEIRREPQGLARRR